MSLPKRKASAKAAELIKGTLATTPRNKATKANGKQETKEKLKKVQKGKEASVEEKELKEVSEETEKQKKKGKDNVEKNEEVKEDIHEEKSETVTKKAKRESKKTKENTKPKVQSKKALDSKKLADEAHPESLSLEKNIKLKNQSDVEVDVSSIIKKDNVVIFIYPRANTPGCTTQVQLFNEKYKELSTKGYKVYGLSNDKPKANLSFSTKYDLGYPLLCDPENKLIKALGAFIGTKVKRSSFLILKGGDKIYKFVGTGPQASLDAILGLVEKLT